jgi:hypothetical protein
MTMNSTPSASKRLPESSGQQQDRRHMPPKKRHRLVEAPGHQAAQRPSAPATDTLQQVEAQRAGARSDVQPVLLPLPPLLMPDLSLRPLLRPGSSAPPPRLQHFTQPVPRHPTRLETGAVPPRWMIVQQPPQATNDFYIGRPDAPSVRIPFSDVKTELWTLIQDCNALVDKQLAKLEMPDEGGTPPRPGREQKHD